MCLHHVFLVLCRDIGIIPGPMLRNTTHTPGDDNLDTSAYTRTVLQFPCSGVKCQAWLYLPKHTEEKPPVIVAAHGIGGVGGAVRGTPPAHTVAGRNIRFRLVSVSCLECCSCYLQCCSCQRVSATAGSYTGLLVCSTCIIAAEGGGATSFKPLSAHIIPPWMTVRSTSFGSVV